MHDTKPHPDANRLFAAASQQGGYFTTAQAREAGYSKALLAHHAKSGRFMRVRRGLYRLREYPSSSREDVMATWLATGADSAVVSHESALDLLELSDIVPELVHVTVPRTKRYRSSSRGVAIHTSTRPLGPKDIAIREGIKVTSPARSVTDAADAGTAPEQIAAAARQAVSRGMATKKQLLELARERGARVERIIRDALEEGVE